MAGVGEVPLPVAFTAAMENLLGEDETAALISALDERPRVRGLRAHPRRVAPDELADQLPGVALAPVTWCDGGFTADGDRLGARPAHLAGLYYLQEPSAMLPVAAAGVAAGDVVVDLAASPGGKTLQVADAVGPEGLVIANEVVRSRHRALSDNLDRWATTNVVTTCAPVERLAVRAAALLPRPGADVVLLDAPCSGEALFRRSAAARREWSPERVGGNARRQAGLLTAAAALVREGGRLVYSTCAFGTAENEDQVLRLVDSGEWDLVAIDPATGIDPGLSGLEGCARIWPHRAAGEGQFVAVLQHRSPVALDAGAEVTSESRRRGHAIEEPGEAKRAWQDFARATLTSEARERLGGPVSVRAGRVVRPVLAQAVSSVVRPGTPLGEVRPGRFVPDQGLAWMLTSRDVHEPLVLTPDDPDLQRFLGGEELASPGRDGWVLVCLGRHALGWGRRRGGRLKNHLPGWMRQMAAGSVH